MQKPPRNVADMNNMKRLSFVPTGYNSILNSENNSDTFDKTDAFLKTTKEQQSLIWFLWSEY